MPDGQPAGLRVLVTGAAGFVGTALTRELLARGHDVVALLRDQPSAGDFFADRLWKRVTVVRGRVEDRFRLRQLLAIHEIQAVAHLAAPARRPAGGFAADWLYGVAEAVAECALSSPVVAPAPFAARRVAEELALTVPAPVRFELLPTMFGPNDRRTESLAMRAASAVAAGERPLPPTIAEAAERYAAVADAARHLADSLELPPADPSADGEVVDAFAGPVWGGADLFAALTRSPNARPRDAALLAAADELLSWTRPRVARPAALLAAA